MSEPSEPIDMHEVRMAAGTAAMELADALDEDILVYVTEAQEPAMKAYRRLRDSGVDHLKAMNMMIGFLLAMLERDRDTA